MVAVFEDKKKTGEKSLEFNFDIVRTVFPYKKDPKTKKWVGHYKYFLDIVNKIFTNKPIDYYFLIHFIIREIRDEFINEHKTKISSKVSTLKGFMLLNYLNKLGILKNAKGGQEMTENKAAILDCFSDEELDIRIKGFFDEFADFFNSNAKKAVFLEGVLVQYLLNIQYQERKATPFRVKLKGLKLDERQIKKLLPEIQNKLEEYGKNYYKRLEEILSRHLIAASNAWEMTNDEVSYYCVLGMNLAGEFKLEKRNKMEDGKDE